MTHVKDSFPASKKTVKNRFESTKTVNVVLSSQSLLSAQQYMHNCTVTLSTSSALLASAPWEQCLFVCLYMHSEQDSNTQLTQHSSVAYVYAAVL